MIRKLKRAFLLLAAVFAVGSVNAEARYFTRTITTNVYDVTVGSVPEVIFLQVGGFKDWLGDSYTTWKSHGGLGEQDDPVQDSAVVIKITDGTNVQIFGDDYDDLYPGRSYNWSVGSYSGTFKIDSQAPRTLNTPDIIGASEVRHSGRNVRDLGGWKLIGTNKRTNFDKFFRSANWDGWINYGGNQICSMHEFATTEIDLRGNNKNLTGGMSPSDDQVRFFSYPVSYSVLDGDGVIPLVNTFKVLGDAQNHPVVFHCTAGKDRTGMVAYFIEALCGMYEEDLYRDFLATTFSGWGNPEINGRYVKTYGGIDYYSRMLRANADKRYGESLAGLTRAYLEDIGVEPAELEVITMALTDEKLNEVLDRVNAVPLSGQVTPPADDPEDDPGDDPDDDPTGGDDDPTGGDGKLDPSTQKATGGNYIHAIKVDGTYYWVHEFSNTTAAASFNNTSGADLPVEYLVVGGGGAGGGGYSGIPGAGGGGGGVIYKTDGVLPAGNSWSVYVGKGGSVTNGTSRIDMKTARIPAGASAISNNTATAVAYAPGGGAGGTAHSTDYKPTVPATSGGSGGGAARDDSYSAGAGMSELGKDGGRAEDSKGAGGGGGYATAGGYGKETSSGNGGNGLDCSITGTQVYYGCGGGGSCGNHKTTGIITAGKGGNNGESGGDGGTEADSPAQNGVAGTGCGGGGGLSSQTSGGTPDFSGNGGDGIVVIRYAVSATPTPPTPSTYTVTFYTNNNQVVKTLENKSSGYTIRNSDLPSVSGGEWDVNPVGAVVSSNTNFTYTILKYWTVTFTRDVTNTLDTIQVADGRTIPSSSIPTIMGSGSWDPDPTVAEITDDTIFNYTTATTPVDPDEPVIPTGGPLAEGGTVTQIEQNGKHYYVHTFTDTTAAQTFVNTSGADLEVEYLVVGGGGAGGLGYGNYGGGGGGGGGGVKGAVETVKVGDTWSITVGKGGSAPNGDELNDAYPGKIVQAGASSITGDGVNVEALGGGHGATVGNKSCADFVASGGGGASRGEPTSPNLAAGGTGVYSSVKDGTTYPEHNGGNGSSSEIFGGGGGGGAAGNGEDGDGTTGGDGGAGISSSITGTEKTYGAGGNGGNPTGGGDGVSGVDGTGCGASGSSGKSNKTSVKSGKGGDGIVIIRYEGVFVPEFEVTFSSNNVPIAEYTVNVISNGHLAASEIPAWAGAEWDVSPYGAMIVCATNFNCVVEEIVVHEMPFSVLGAAKGSQLSFEGSYTPDSGSHADGKVYVAANTEATLRAIDVTGKTYCGCWRDDSTGELFWGETVVVTPTKPTTYTACFGPMWSLYKDPYYDTVAANQYYHLDNGIWDFKVTIDTTTKKIRVWKMLSHDSADTDCIVNFTTQIMDWNGGIDQYTIATFSNWDEQGDGYAEVFDNHNSDHLLPKLLLLPVTTEEVDVMAFCRIDNMTGILCIPENVTLQKQAFGYSKSLEGVIFKGGVEGGQIFGIKEYWDKTGHKVDFGNQFENSPNIKGSIVLPRTITALPNYCFYSDKSIQEIDLTYVTEIGERALFDCHSLTNAINLEAVTSVLYQGCDGCWNLSGDVTFTNLVVGNYNAFANCGFTSVKLPKATEFHYGVFANDVKLTNIVFSQWRQVVFAHNVEDDHPQWPYTVSLQRGCYCTNNLPCWLTFPGPAPVFSNMAHRATCSILFGEHDVASGSQPVIAPKELCLEANWDYDADGWQKIYDEIGDPMPYNSARPIQKVPADLDVRGTINWMYKYDHTEFEKTYSDDPIENARLKSKYGYEDLENNKAKAFLICRPKGLYFFVK